MLGQDQLKEYEQDLYFVSLGPSGERFLLRLLMNYGLGNPVGSSAESIARYNLGLELLNDLAIANPAAAANIVMSLFNIVVKRDAG